MCQHTDYVPLCYLDRSGGVVIGLPQERADAGMVPIQLKYK